VCQFTQALLVNVSQGLHMLHGVLQCRDGNEKVINICDSGGKSNLVFGLATLLNILLCPRPRSRNMKLWAPSSKRDYKNIGQVFAGEIRWDRLDKGWRDMVWVLASIAAGSAPPAVIFERLAAQPKHPATAGFEELGKLERSDYLLRYGHDLSLRRFVQSHTVRREHYNGFTRQVRAFGDLVREKSREGQEELLWFLAVVQNAIVLWNAVALNEAVDKARTDGHDISDEDLKHVLPTMLEHINFVGRFLFDLRRRPPFRFVVG
jgi:TnpA family transposase